MKIHEYQAKEILKTYGVPVPKGGVTGTPEKARRIAEGIGEKSIVVKAQMHAGGTITDRVAPMLLPDYSNSKVRENQLTAHYVGTIG
jgi:acyl-CoA synthetase (NDP forming)